MLGGILGRLASSVCSPKEQLEFQTGADDLEQHECDGTVAKAVQTDLSQTELSPIRSKASSPLRLDESARLQRLCEVQALGLESTKLLDDITAVLGWVSGMPIVLVSLVTAERLCFQSRFGLNVRKVPREEFSLCAWCIAPSQPTVLIVEDARTDCRVMKSGIVQGPPYIRFYAGCPLQTSDGFPLGTLCLIDQQPQKVSPEVSQLLVNFAEIVTRNIERCDLEDCELPSVAISSPDQEQEPPPPQLERFARGPWRREQVCRSLRDAHLLVIVSKSSVRWPIVYADSRWQRLTNISVVPPSREFPAAQTNRVHFWDVASYLDPCGMDARSGAAPRPDEHHSKLIGAGATFSFAVLLTAVGKRSSVEAVCRCIPAGEPLDSNAAAFAFETAALVPAGQALSPRLGDEERLYFFIVHPVEATATSEAREGVKELDHWCEPSRIFQELEQQQLIGKGSFGQVYLATWIGAQVAAKFLHRRRERVQAGAGGCSVFEGALSAMLKHPNVVQTYEYTSREVEIQDAEIIRRLCSIREQVPKTLVVHEMLILQEWCDRGSLTSLLRTCYPLGPKGGGMPEVFAIATDLAAALVYMHGKNIVHGDLSSNNVLLKTDPFRERGYTAKISDFGLSRALRDEAAVTSKTIGSIHYMPPEMLTIGIEPAELSCKVDVFSMGVIIWQLCTGRYPFAGLAPAQVVVRVQRGERLKLDPETIPPGLLELMEECMDHNPATRLDTNHAFTRLNNFCSKCEGF